MVDRSRRGFLSFAGRLAGASAVATLGTTTAIAAVVPVIENDPVFELADHFLAADQASERRVINKAPRGRRGPAALHTLA
jgi:hypothetical protein